MLFLLLACTSADPVPPEAPVTPTCIVTWKRTSSVSLLHEQRGLGAAAWPDFPARYLGGTPGPTDTPATTDGLTVAGVPAIWFRGDDAIVDARFFDNLWAVDATTLATGEVGDLGTATPEARAGLGDRGVAEFLIRADILRIYAHVEGEVCLVEESKADGAWRGRFVGEHTYFTNGEHHARLGFTVTVAADGKVTVNGS